MSYLREWLAVLAIMCFVFAAGSATAQDSATIPLDPSARPAGNGFHNFVTVSVGGGPPSQVLLDTGSSGLRFLRSRIGPDVKVTNIPVTYGYSSGNYLSGYLGYAPVSFPESGQRLSTAGPIAIQVVTSVTCKEEHPRCPGWAPAESGVMGVDYQNSNIFNPLAQLPGNLGSGFIVVSNDISNPRVEPRIVVGLTPESMRGFAFAPLGPAESGRQPAGLQTWNTKGIQVCFAVDSGPPGCGNAVFDTGAGNGSFVTPASPQSGRVPSGNTVTLTVPNVLSLSLRAGERENTERFAYEAPHGNPPGFNTGSEVYRYYAVLFDERNGRIGFSPVVNWIFGTYEPADDAALGAPDSAIAVGGTLVMREGFVSDRPIYLLRGAVLKVRGRATLSGTLSGRDPLIIEGPGTLDLTGESVYSGRIQVKSGRLLVNGVLPAHIFVDRGASVGGRGIRQQP